MQESKQLEEVEKKTLYQVYTNYIDSSEITKEYYLNRKFHAGQENYFHLMNKWLEDDHAEDNKPLVFRTRPGMGIKTIFTQWNHQMEQLNCKRKQKYLNIVHYASNGSNNQNYFYCLYRIIIKLREALKIKQSADLLEEKIRKYFAYWLDICNSEVERQKVIYCSQEIYDKIIIIIEGIDKFIDLETGKEANIAFWLPEKFPKNIKVICSVSQNSEAFMHFQKIGCEIITLEYSPSIISSIYEEVISRKTIFTSKVETFLKQKLKEIVKKKQISEIYEIIDSYSSFLLVPQHRYQDEELEKIVRKAVESKDILEKIGSVESLSQLFETLISIWSQSYPGKKKLRQLLLYLSLSQKGLTVKEIIFLSKISQKEWRQIKSVFSDILLSYQGLYSIKNRPFISILLKIEKQESKQKEKENFLLKFHENISESLDTTSNSIRKLEQQTYHLFVSKSYFKLKEIVSNIENFLLLFNPNNKYQLSRYWQKLQEKGFDPVIEYNKAIEGFSMHYHPSDENIFRIIVQISKFLKEFCDFQTYKTPCFRHPYIEGNMMQLQKIGLLKQFAKLDIYVDNSFSPSDQPDKMAQTSLDEQIKSIREKYFPKDNQQIENTKEGMKEKKNGKTFEDPEINNKIKKKASMKILSDIEQLNVDVPMNRDKFRIHYLHALCEYLEHQEYQSSKNQIAFFEVQDQVTLPNHGCSHNQEYSFTKIRENYRMRKIDPSLYYYKRWIWIQFPWVCISLNNNYSNTPELCKSLEEDFESHEQEAKYTKQALIVAIEAKQKKKQMFTKTNNSSMGLQSTGFNHKSKVGLGMTGYSSGSRIGDKSCIRTRMLNKSTTTIDLNLNALTKQLELRKKNLQVDPSPKQEIFLSEIKDNCHEDMKFISQRKPFETPEMRGMASDQILPKLKWTIKQHTNYEINYIKEHIEQKRKKLNKIIYTNKKLAQTYKELKMKENLTKKNLHEQEQEKNSRKNKIIEELIQKKEQVINDFCRSLLQEERLKIVLKLCSENKTRNEEYLASLNYFLQSLKKMINWEKENIKSITKEMNGIKLMKQKQQMLELQKQKNQEILQKQAHKYLEEKEKIEQQIENIETIITDDIKNQKDRLQNTLSGHLKHREEKNIMLIQQRKAKQLQEKLINLKEDYEALKNLFQFDDMNFLNSQKFRNLLEEHEKNKKLKIIYFQQKNKLQKARKELQQIKINYQKAKENELSNDKKKNQLQSINIEEKKKDQTQVKLENKLKIMLDNITLKLGISSIQDIVPTLKQKVKEVKQTNGIKYQEIMSIAKQYAEKNSFRHD